MKVRMQLPGGLEWLDSNPIGIGIDSDTDGLLLFAVREDVYVYKNNPRVHYLVWSRVPGNARATNGIANPLFIAKAIGSNFIHARHRVEIAFTAHYSRPQSEWNTDVNGNVLLSVTEPGLPNQGDAYHDPQEENQETWRDRPPLL